MTIGIVLSKTPGYSETFFNSKIEGLLASGFEVQLFVQHKDASFRLCPVTLLTKVYRTNIVLRGWALLTTFFRLVPHGKAVQHFVRLERQRQSSWGTVVKRLYANVPLLTAKLDWLHFGFATMALQREVVAKAIGAQMAVSVRGYDVDVYPLKFPGAYNSLWQHVDKVHAISQHTLKMAMASGMSPSTPYAVIMPAVNFDTLPKISQAKENHTLQFLTVGRLHPIKGIVATLEALAILKKEAPEIQFHFRIIGTGPDYEPIAFAIHQMELQPQVQLMGEQPHAKVLETLATTDIYIQYSHSEGFCNAVLEAQAMGCLCVVSDGGALTENVLDGDTGYVVVKRNPKQLAETLLKIIHLPKDQKQRLVDNAQDRVRLQFGMEIQQQAFAAFYE